MKKSVSSIRVGDRPLVSRIVLASASPLRMALWLAILIIAALGVTSCNKQKPSLPEVIVEGQAGINGIAVDQKHIYFTLNPAGSVMKIDKAGGTSTAIVAGQEKLQQPLVADTKVFWSVTGSDILRFVRPEGGEPELFEPNKYGRSEAMTTATATDGSDVYWATSKLSSPGATIYRVDSYEAKFVSSTEKPVFALAVSSAMYFYASDKVVYGAPKGGSVKKLAETKEFVATIAASGQRVFWIDGDILRSVDAAAESVSTIAAGGVRKLAVDDSHVYWTTNSQVMRAPVAGGKVEEFVNTQQEPAFVVVDDAYVYWSLKAGKILRLKKPSATRT